MAYHEYESRSNRVIVGVTCQIVIATLMIGLRLLSRRLNKQFTSDDITAIAAWLGLVGCGTCVLTMTNYGLGKHESTLSDRTIMLYLRNFWFSIIFYLVALFFLKMTFLLHYYRLLCVSGMRKLTMGFIIFVILSAMSQVVSGFVQCIPLNAIWDKTVKGQCFPNPVLWYRMLGAIHIVSDFGILLLPLPDLWKLHLPLAKKIYLLGVFGIGFLSIGISIERMQWLNIQVDTAWSNATAAIWSLAELTSALSCACLPFFRPLGVRIASAFTRSRFYINVWSRPVEREMQSATSGMGLQGRPRHQNDTQDSAEIHPETEMRSII